jgi:hypothetical protein
MLTKNLPITIEKSANADFDARFVMSAATPDRVKDTISPAAYKSATKIDINRYHYVYKLTAINPLDERRFYIGVRTSTTSPDLDPYMGSSNSVNEAISNGVVFEKKILATAFTREDAVSMEIGLHRYHDAKNNPKFFNLCNQVSTGFDCGPLNSIKLASLYAKGKRLGFKAGNQPSPEIISKGQKKRYANETVEQKAARVAKMHSPEAVAKRLQTLKTSKKWADFQERNRLPKFNQRGDNHWKRRKGVNDAS